MSIASHDIHRPEVSPEVSTPIPQEWVNELQGLDSRSYEYRQMVETLGELAAAEGMDFSAALASESQGTGGDVPRGYVASETVPGYSTNIDPAQFKGSILPLADRTAPLRVGVTELTTDTGNKFRLCDLRPEMTNSVQKNGPGSKSDAERLDDALMRDLKIVADTGQSRNTVTGVKGVSYTKVKGTKIRAYFMRVDDRDNLDGPPTYARIADCSSESSQAALYRAVFGRTV